MSMFWQIAEFSAFSGQILKYKCQHQFKKTGKKKMFRNLEIILEDISSDNRNLNCTSFLNSMDEVQRFYVTCRNTHVHTHTHTSRSIFPMFLLFSLKKE